MQNRSRALFGECKGRFEPKRGIQHVCVTGSVGNSLLLEGRIHPRIVTTTIFAIHTRIHHVAPSHLFRLAAHRRFPSLRCWSSNAPYHCCKYPHPTVRSLDSIIC